jgi:hypothetical protein
VRDGRPRSAVIRGASACPNGFGADIMVSHTPEFMVVERGPHGGMIVPAMPVVLDFFAEIAKGNEAE